MATYETNGERQENGLKTISFARWLTQIVLLIVIQGIILFLSAGTTLWPMAWAYLIVLGLGPE